MEKAFAVDPDEIYHETCFAKQYANDEKQPEYNEVVPNADDECDYCGGLVMEAPDPDIDEDDEFVGEDDEDGN